MDPSTVAYVIGFIISFFFVIKGADFAIVYATRLARIAGVSEFAISFFLVGLVNALPESVISFTASAKAEVSLAATALLASNVVDLTFVFGVIALFASGLYITTPILKRESFYLLLLALPLLLGFDGTISRLDGIILLAAGLVFLYSVASTHKVFASRVARKDIPLAVRTIVLLIVSLLVMVVAANFTVSFVGLIAAGLGVSQVLIAVFVIGIGTCLPELLFTIRTVQKGKNDLALGNILGVVIMDATIMLGTAAIIRPLVLEQNLLRTLTLFNLLGGVALIYFIKIKKQLTRWEAVMLLVLYGVFAAIQFRIH